MKAVWIPDSVKRIGKRDFAKCSSLVFVRLPPLLKYIGEGAFALCVSMQSVYIPSTVERIDKSAFLNCFKNPTYCVSGDGIVEDCNELLGQKKAGRWRPSGSSVPGAKNAHYTKNVSVLTSMLN